MSDVDLTHNVAAQISGEATGNLPSSDNNSYFTTPLYTPIGVYTTV